MGFKLGITTPRERDHQLMIIFMLPFLHSMSQRVSQNEHLSLVLRFRDEAFQECLLGGSSVD